MQKLKGIDALDKVINDFLAEFEVSASMGADFCYWCGKGQISYTLIMPEASKNYFMQHFNRLAPDLECDEFLASLLHELGHHMTEGMLEENEIKYSNDLRSAINLKFCNKVSEEENAQLHQEYFNLPDEHEATMWAIEYTRNYTEKVAAFWEKLRPAIMNFYSLNGILEEA